MGNDVVIRQLTSGELTIQLSNSAAVVFEAALQKLRKRNDAVTPKLLLMAYCACWASGSLASGDVSSDANRLAQLENLLRELPPKPKDSETFRISDLAQDPWGPMAAHEPAESVRQHLRPRVISRALVQMRAWERRRSPLVAPFFWCPIGEHLACQVVFDTGGTAHNRQRHRRCHCF